MLSRHYVIIVNSTFDSMNLVSFVHSFIHSLTHSYARTSPTLYTLRNKTSTCFQSSVKISQICLGQSSVDFLTEQLIVKSVELIVEAKQTLEKFKKKKVKQ